MSHGFLCVYAYMILMNSWVEFMKCYSLDGTTYATGATHRQYLALSKAWQSCFF